MRPDVLERCDARLSQGVAEDAAVRLFHGRGYCYPGHEDHHGRLSWPGHLLVGCFGEDLEGATRLPTLAGHLPGLRGVAVQERRGRATRCEVISGYRARKLWSSWRRGSKFLVRPLRNQNIGLFLDMAPTRTWVQNHAQSASVC